MELHWGTVLRPARQCCRKTGHLCHQSTHLPGYRALLAQIQGVGWLNAQYNTHGQKPFPWGTPPLPLLQNQLLCALALSFLQTPPHCIRSQLLPAACELSHRVVITCPESWFPRLGPALDPWGLLPFLYQSLAHPRYQLLVPRGPWAVKI